MTCWCHVIVAVTAAAAAAATDLLAAISTALLSSRAAARRVLTRGRLPHADTAVVPPCDDAAPLALRGEHRAIHDAYVSTQRAQHVASEERPHLRAGHVTKAWVGASVSGLSSSL